MVNDQQAFEMYQMYFGEVKDLYEGYMATSITITAAILGIIGWFLTSDNARKVVSSSKAVMMGTVAGSIITALSEGWVTWHIHLSSRQLTAIISKYAGILSLTPDHYSYKILIPEIILPFYGFHVVLLVMLAVIVVNKSRSIEEI